MKAVMLAALAAGGSFGLASLVVAPAAVATSKPTTRPRPTTSSSHAHPKSTKSSSPKPTPAPTVTKTRTVAPTQPCNPKVGSPASQMTTAPWPQQTLNFTDVWPLTQGDRVKVAIVDSGVDTGHPQLPNIDAYDLTGTGKKDCTGHGTMLAGIIAAQDQRNDHVPFLGVAPRVHLVSVKVATQPTGNSPSLLAQGIRRAAALGAKIICVSSTTANYPYLKDAVRNAEASGALLVAAAGNTAQDKKDSEQELYPASYDGVISVGAVDRDGKLQDFTDAKSRISVLAPGKAVISTWPGDAYYRDDGTSFAAPYVAGTAALIKARFPGLTATQIKHRIEVTADGGTLVGSGHGVINPLRAVTAVLPEEDAGGRQAPPKAHPVALVEPTHPNHFTRTMAIAIVGGALGVSTAVAAGGIIIPAGRRRNWRPTRRATPTDDS
ncbi:MAG: S8 family serine peptidase [Actinoallomurus sp.]